MNDTEGGKFGPMKVAAAEKGCVKLESADNVERGEVILKPADQYFIGCSYTYDYIDEDDHIRNSHDYWRLGRSGAELNIFLTARFGVKLTDAELDLLSAVKDEACPVCQQTFLDKWEEPTPDGLIVGYVHSYETTYHESDRSFGCFSFHPVVRE